MEHQEATRAAEIYDSEAASWQRDEPVIWSDVTARPWALGAVVWAGRRVLDLGCGEGYVARRLRAAGAASVTGIDVSSEMIDRALQAAVGDRHQQYHVGDVSDAAVVSAATGNQPYDAVVAVFVANYLTVAQTTSMLAAARAACRDGAELVLVAPHPSLPWTGTDAPPVSFDHGGASYKDVDTRMTGRLWRFDGTTVTVLNHHKRTQDWFDTARRSGWEITELAELSVPATHCHLVEPAQAGVALHLGLHLRAR